MTAERSERQITEEDITEFGRQLYEWTKTLPHVQQGLLHRILSRAAGESDDTAGHGFELLQSLPYEAFAGLVNQAASLSFIPLPPTGSRASDLRGQSA
jgi:hypothetical protein